MSCQQDLCCARPSSVNRHISPPAFCAVHLPAELMSVRTGESCVPDLIGDVPVSFARVVELDETVQLGHSNRLLNSVHDVDVVGISQGPVLHSRGFPVVAWGGGHDHTRCGL